MTTQQRQAVGTGPRITPVVDQQPAGPLADAAEPAWLWESLRFRFWDPADLARSLRPPGGLEPEQQAAVAYWWSLLAAAERLGPRLYAAAFVRAAERDEGDQVRWSLVAMLRDTLQHERLFGLGMQRLVPGWASPTAPATMLGRQAEQHLRTVDQEAERCWNGQRRALDRHGIAVLSGALLLGALVTGDLYERCAPGATSPAVATAFRHLGHDARRHQGVLRALASRDWPRLPASERAEAATQLQAMERFLSTVLLDDLAGEPPGFTTGGLATGQGVPRRACLGVPSVEQRQEILRAALLKVRDLQGLCGVPFPAMPHLAIPGIGQTPNGLDGEGEMLVSECCHHVLMTTEPDETLLDAAGRMNCYQIGALPVYEQHRLIGIVTERDIVAALSEGADPTTTSVAEYMTELPVTIAPDDDVTLAAHRMAELGVRHLPVVEGNHLVGMLSMRDLMAGPAVMPTPTG
jgi:predicted transcriptional regulator